MTKARLSLLLGLIACVAAIGFVHWRALRTVESKTALLQRLNDREGAIDAMSLALEKYRRESASFRKMAPAEIAQSKEALKRSFKEGSQLLETIEPAPGETGQGTRLTERLLDFLDASNKLEAQLYSKDAYVKPEIREQHDAISKLLQEMREEAERRLGDAGSRAVLDGRRSLGTILGIGGGLALAALLLLVWHFVAYVLPLRRLSAHARLALETGHGSEAAPGGRQPRLPRVHSEIRAAIDELAARLDSYSRERHRFVSNVVSDLRVPLGLLQEARKTGLSSDTIPVLKRGLALLSASLEDLEDIADMTRVGSRLNDAVVDLAELASDVSRLLGGATHRAVSAQVPQLPVWVQVDVRRLERALLQAAAKVLSTLPETRPLRIEVLDAPGPGVEIRIREYDPKFPEREVQPGGPEVELSRHWIAEQGLGLVLAQRVVRAHGGQAWGAGNPGSSAQIGIRLPAERVVSRGLVAPPTGLARELSGPGGRGRKGYIDFSPL